MKIKLKFRKRIKFHSDLQLISTNHVWASNWNEKYSINTGKKLFFLNTVIPVKCIYDCKKLYGFSIKTTKKIKW